MVIFYNVTEWKTEPIVKLYKSAGWWKDEYNPAEIPGLIKKSFRFIVGINEETDDTIAMGRILSDGISTAVIQDLCVLPEYQSTGIGKRLLHSLLNSLKESEISRVYLIAEPYTENFYEKSAFIKLKDHSFLLHNG